MTKSTRPSKIHLPPRETLFRVGRASVGETSVEVSETGGRFESGFMTGVSLISVGEALGHHMWIDAETLNQVANFAQSSNGVKSRFTHPGMSSDGLGRHLGRVHNSAVSGSRVIGDLHFTKSSRDTPDGDLAGYVIELAKEDPEAAGLSIVFEHDIEAENEFMLANGATIVNGWIEGFQSPDENNVNNYPHVRLAKLHAADIVDEPAANPDGLFDSQTLPRELDGLLKYATGLSKTKPTDCPFDIDPDRATQFFTRWLSSNGFSLTSIGDGDMTAKPDEATPEAPTRESFLGELKKYTDRFGAENGTKFFEDGVGYTEALEKFCDQQGERITTLESERDEATAKLESLTIGEADPIDATVTQDGKEPERLSLGSLMRPQKN